MQWIPTAGVIGTCALWGLDNNLTRAVSHRDALQIATIKCLIAGLTNGAIAWALDQTLVISMPDILRAFALGAAGYGLSLVLFVSALAHLGSARTAALFGTAPFIGAATAVVIGEPLTASLLFALVLTGLSTWLVLSESHAHVHRHEALEHEHVHAHDEHHEHSHSANEGDEPHCHRHTHAPLTHSHAHLPDLHHRHGHK
ncbi:MAG: DMT family transporter [Steroidobacteraceae bacterium]